MGQLVAVAVVLAVAGLLDTAVASAVAVVVAAVAAPSVLPAFVSSSSQYCELAAAVFALVSRHRCTH